MTPNERLWAAMRREEVDKVPCSPRLGQALHILYDDFKTDATELIFRAVKDLDIAPHFIIGSGLPEFLMSTGDNTQGFPDVRCTVEVLDDGPCRIFKRRFETPAGPLSQALRMPKPGRLEYGLGPNPHHLEHLVKGPEDLDRMRYLVPDPRDFRIAPSLKATEKRVGDRGVVMVNIRSPLDHQAGAARAVEDLMVDYYEDRKFFDRLIGMWFDKMMAETKAVLERGAKIIFGSWYYTSLSVGWSPAIFREVFLPQIKAQVALVHSYGAMYDYYDDGKCMGIIDMIQEAGVDVFETLTPPPVGDVDLAEVKRRIGGKVCLKGYGDLLYVIKMGTPQDVENMVRKAMEIAAPGGGFIFGTSDSIREGTPRENVRMYFEAARKYGKMM
jgi:uroporphyrinogen-III decarboxylase